MKFKIKVQERSYYEVVVEAPTRHEAENVAKKETQCPDSTPVKSWVAVDDVQHLSEEGWVTGGWYDLQGPDNIVVLSRSIGNCFTKQDVERLGARLSRLGLRVLEQWNGAGCDTVSFRCEGRIGTQQFTAGQLEMLLSPRLEGDAR